MTPKEASGAAHFLGLMANMIEQVEDLFLEPEVEEEIYIIENGG